MGSEGETTPIDATRRQFERHAADSVSILTHEHQPLVVGQRHDLHPIGAFEHVIGFDFDAIGAHAIVGAQMDPAVGMDDAAGRRRPVPSAGWDIDRVS